MHGCLPAGAGRMKTLSAILVDFGMGYAYKVLVDDATLGK
jgi:hypothetical protein